MTVSTQATEDLTATARNMVDSALAVATGRLAATSPAETLERVIGGDQAALAYFRHELAHQVAMLLLLSDRHLIALYLDHDLPEAEDCVPSELRLTDPIQLVVCVERETAALSGLVRAVDRSLCGVLSQWQGTAGEGLVIATMIQPVEVRRLHARVNGFRPPPTLLVSRGGENGPR
jgi:hypothetical protein